MKTPVGSRESMYEITGHDLSRHLAVDPDDHLERTPDRRAQKAADLLETAELWLRKN